MSVQPLAPRAGMADSPACGRPQLLLLREQTVEQLVALLHALSHA